MRLKKLKLHGFKSFADQVEMSFEDGITGVVGPNGCGKSNIADAVRWVLGEQSAKTLRGTKMEDVIFNGTEKRRRLAYCEVTLVFDNEDHGLPLDFVEVAVSRRVYRSGEGEYAINGTPCRLKDIIDLFRDTGIGKEGYSLIGQGRIDELLSAKSEDRRQIFEEAAGIVKYKARKTEAQRRMENTRQNLERVEDILSELERRVEPLRQQSEAAREYLNLRDELKDLDLNAFLVRTERYNARIAELKETGAALAESLSQAAAEQERLSAAREEKQLELDRLELDAAEKRDDVQELIRDVEAREGVVSVMRERIAATTRERERLQGEHEAAENGGVGIQQRVETLEKEIEAETASLSAAETALSTREAALADQEYELSAKEEKAETAKQEIINAMNRLGDVRGRQGQLTAMKTALERQIASMAEDQDRGAAGTESLNEQVQAASDQLAAENARKKELEALVADSVAKVRAQGDEAQELSERRSKLLASKQQYDSRVKLLSEMQRDYEGYQNSVKQVLLQARRLGGAGVHGVVADLIHAPEKLERALDMVLGAALQNVVVDRDEDAKRMIEYLRANRFGRATFLPISSVRGRTLSPQERQVLSMPGCVGLASELVSFDKRYAGIIDNLLGRTVVAENLDAGIAIQRAGRYAFRLVTLEGDVMHSGGSMTGGSVQSRATSLLSRTREIEEGRAALMRIEQSLDELQTRLSALEDQRDALKKERSELYDALHRQEVVCARIEAQLEAAREEQRSHGERVARVEQEKARLEAQLSEVNESLEQLSGQTESEQKNTREMQAQVRELQNEIFHLREETEAARKEVTEARVSLATRQRGLQANIADRDRLIAQAGDLDRLLRESEEALRRTERELADNAGQLEKDEAALAEEKKALDAARTSFREADEKRTAAQKQLQELMTQSDAMRESMEALSDKHHRAELQLSRVEGEFKQITDRIWEEYELTYAGAEPFRRADFKLTEAEKRIAQIRARIREMGTVNVAALDEYRQTVARVEELTAQRDDLNKAQDDLQGIIEELEKKMETQFKQQFEVLNQNFQRTFVRLFGGGKAELRLGDPKDALNCGIDIVAQPPGKKLQMLSLLAGGERALTAIAILFAMLDLKPTPFCILDEIEAALDDANIDNYAEYLKSYSRNTQFVVITHRKGTMERCDSLYGVVMEEKGVSKMVSVLLNEAS